MGRLPGNDELFDDHDDHYHPGVVTYAFFIVEVDQVPGHGPAKKPDGESKFHGFDPGIDT
jgi:hypothetical protein